MLWWIGSCDKGVTTFELESCVGFCVFDSRFLSACVCVIHDFEKRETTVLFMMVNQFDT